ncbi:hypothetical protein LguiB_012906 [Lonicera macranthoides]
MRASVEKEPNLVGHAVVRITMSYLDDDKGSLQRSAIIVNAQEGLTSILGLMLLWLLHPRGGGYFIEAIQIAIGEAGQKPFLRAFLNDQLKNNNNSPDDKFWWYIPRFIGSLIAIFVLATNGWKTNFLISTIVMGCALLFFLSGVSFYHWENRNPTNSPATIFRVIKAAVVKRKLTYPVQPDDYFKNSTNQLSPSMSNQVSKLRWLDKAAIIERKSSSPSEDEQEKQGRLCTVAQVKVVKNVIRMVPIWATLLLFSFVKTTGSTFFYQQSANLDHKIIDKFSAPLISLYLIQGCSYYASLYASNLIISKWFNVDKGQYLVATKVRIGIGLVCACLCCFAARKVEIKRLAEIKRFQELNHGDNLKDYVLRMSFFWLAPQFCLLGLSEGLIEEGIIKFFCHHNETLAEYGEAFNELVLGIGKFTSIFWVLTFSMWIRDTVDNSRLDHYYAILAILSLSNLFIVYGFALVSKYRYGDAGGVESDEINDVAALNKVIDEVG